MNSCGEIWTVCCVSDNLIFSSPVASVVVDALRLYLCLSVSYFGTDLARILWYSRPLFMMECANKTLMSKVLATRVTVIHCPLQPWHWLRVIEHCPPFAKSNDQTVFICNTYSGASETFTHCCTFLFVILLSVHYVSIRLSNPKRLNPLLTTRIKRQLVAQQWCKPKAQPSRMWRFDAVFRSNMSQSLSKWRESCTQRCTITFQENGILDYNLKIDVLAWVPLNITATERYV